MHAASVTFGLKALPNRLAKLPHASLLDDCASVLCGLVVRAVLAGVDPKSVVCEYYRAGKCQKGFKCKYSHDLKVERKTQKKNLYEDKKTEEEEGAHSSKQVQESIPTLQQVLYSA